MASVQLGAAALAFDSIAADFDSRFAHWRSVAAQRSAVRRELADAFPRGARLIEFCGGTGEDALWLAGEGREVLMTDASPQMVEAASIKGNGRFRTAVADVEELAELADLVRREGRFDGAYSVFAGLNCVRDLGDFARQAASMLGPGAPLLLVLFGTLCPGEMVVETLRGRPGHALRRFRRGNVPARLAGREFTVRYHRRRRLERMLAPWFQLESRTAIGLFVPPSAAEPWISDHPRLLAALAGLDRLLARPLAALGDHILYHFVRSDR